MPAAAAGYRLAAIRAPTTVSWPLPALLTTNAHMEKRGAELLVNAGKPERRLIAPAAGRRPVRRQLPAPLKGTL